MRWLLRSLVVGACAFAAATASAQRVNVDFDEQIDFSKYKTFVVRRGPDQSPIPALNNELTQKHLERALERELTARGLKKADAQPDVNVFYILSSRGVTEREAFPSGPRGLGTRVERVPATQGNLVISVRDPQTRSLVWRGVASDEKSRPEDIAKRLDEWVKKVVEKYPPKK